VDEEAPPVKKRWTLIVVAAVLVVLVGGYLALRYRPRPAAKPAESASVVLSSFEPAKLVKIVLSRSAGTLIAEKKGKDWRLNTPVPVALSQSAVDDLVSSFADLRADRVIDENPTDLSSFGLKPPRATAEGTLDDGTVKTFYLGDKTPSGTAFYLQVKGDPKVYSVWPTHGEHFQWTASDLRDRKLGPAMKQEDVTSLLIRERGGRVIEMRAKSEAEKKSFQFGFGAFLMTRPYPYPVGVDGQKGGPILDAALGLEIGEFIDDSPKSLARYGLDRPWGELMVRDKANNVLDLLFGADKAPDKVYVLKKGAPNVYALEKSRISFMDDRPFDLIDRFAFIPSIDDVDRLEIVVDGKTRTLTLSRTVKKAEKKAEASGGANEEQDETVTTYAVDGKSVEESSFKGFYQSLIGLSVEGETEHVVSGPPEVTTRFFLNKGELHQAVVTYVPYDRDFDAVFVNGKGAFALTKLQLRKMASKLESLARGEKVSD
jgi:hypothetical protein